MPLEIFLGCLAVLIFSAVIIRVLTTTKRVSGHQNDRHHRRANEKAGK